ncbi:MAG: sigma-54-dependent Fis family transcriptional regulator, partial [Deltaproteobacteria bacterium]|nr:sigma-54-dependent Fis family transcriptional regulator [Deltaproteobacteria bacterium]
IRGESGTGKELVARLIHAKSPRRYFPLVPVNCGALNESLLESELFGHEKGSFTGANTQKIGKFELADGGTLFLDEVGSIPINLQVKLLRALQERIIQRVGGTKDIAVDIRVIAATNSNLEEEIKKGNFREDLYYRLKVVPIELPPLRERIDDMELLIEWFLETHSKECRKKILGISTEAINALKGYAWPGNVRELENMIERLVVLAPNNSEITLKDLPAEISAVRVDRRRYPVDGIDYKAALRQFEEKYIGAVLNEVAWNKGEAAKHMKVHRNTLLNKIRSLGLSKARAKEKPKL